MKINVVRSILSIASGLCAGMALMAAYKYPDPSSPLMTAVAVVGLASVFMVYCSCGDVINRHDRELERRREEER